MDRRGISLLEVLSAAVLSLILFLGLTQLDVSRSRLTQQPRSAIRSEAGFALAQMARSLEQADRINLLDAGNIQIRLPQPQNCATTPPEPSCFDAAGSFRWVQYRFDPATHTIQVFEEGNCQAGTVLARDIDAVTIARTATLNTVQAAITSRDPATDVEFTYEKDVTIRAGTAKLEAGLDVSGISAPPGACS